MNNFAGLKYFRPDSAVDSWGDPTKISRELLEKLEALRESVGAPIYVTSGYRTYNENSQHAFGRAVDVICPDLPLYDFYQAAERIGFSGLGVYPHWRFHSVPAGGLHLDVRPGKDARWMGVKNPKNVQVYVGLDEDNLRKYGVIR